jgi:hypothetical protein
MSDDNGTIYKWNSLYVFFVAQDQAGTPIGLLPVRCLALKLRLAGGDWSLVVEAGV